MWIMSVNTLLKVLPPTYIEKGSLFLDKLELGTVQLELDVFIKHQNLGILARLE